MDAREFFYVFMMGSLTAQGIEPARADVLINQMIEERLLK